MRLDDRRLPGLDRFHPDSPGWSVGGGISGDYMPCPDCAAAAEPLPVDGMFAALFASGTVRAVAHRDRVPERPARAAGSCGVRLDRRRAHRR